MHGFVDIICFAAYKVSLLLGTDYCAQTCFMLRNNIWILQAFPDFRMRFSVTSNNTNNNN